MTGREKLKIIFSRELPIKEKALLSAVIAFALSFTFFFFGMLIIFITNYTAFPVIISEVLLAAIITFLLGFAVIFAILVIIPGKLFRIAASIMIGLLIAGYLQNNFFNNLVDLGLMTGDIILWHWLAIPMLINLIIWAVIILLPVIIRFFVSYKAWKQIILFTCVLITVIQAVVLVFSYTQNRENLGYVPQHYLSREGIYEVSSLSNIIVFVVDRLDYRFIDDIRKDDPGFFDRLDGFTEFTNTAGAYSSTFPAGVFLTTGVLYDFEQQWNEYFDYAWNNSDFIDTLKDNGYATNYHMGDGGFMFTNYEQIINAADNIRDGRPKPVLTSIIDNFLDLSAYRFSPLFLKPFFWMPGVSIEFTGYITNYDRAVGDNDVLFMEVLAKNGLTIQQQHSNYTYIHFMGAHAPFNMDEHAMYAGLYASDVISQTKGCFRIIYHYLDEMKQLGVYEDSTILIVGDHGVNENSIHIGCFFKPAGAAGAALEQNDAPVSYMEHLIPSLLKSEGLDYEPYGTALFDVEEDIPGERYAIVFTQGSNAPVDIRLLRITGHVSNKDNIETIDSYGYALGKEDLPLWRLD